MTGRGTIETLNKMLGCIDAFRASPPCDCNCHSCECFASAEEKKEAMLLAISALEKQEQSCDTCRHGRFGDRQCDNCGVRYPNHYEAEEEA